MEYSKKKEVRDIYSIWTASLAKEDLEFAGVYLIESSTGVKYVGKTTKSFQWRAHKHVTDLVGGRHHCQGLASSFNQLGGVNFRFFPLEKFKIDEECLLETAAIINRSEEEHWLRLYNLGQPLYNDRPSGGGSVRHSELTKQKIRQTIQANNRLKSGSLFERLDDVTELARDMAISQPEAAIRLDVSRSALQRFCYREHVTWVYHTQVKEKRKATLIGRLEEVITFSLDEKTNWHDIPRAFGVSPIVFKEYLDENNLRWNSTQVDRIMCSPDKFIRWVKDPTITQQSLLREFNISSRAFGKAMEALKIYWVSGG
jgi:hypothetical protein